MTTPQSTPPFEGTAPATPGNAFWQRFRDLGTLRRPAEHRALGGVAEGLSRHFDIDPIIVRVLFVALTFFGGAGIILYLALWLTVPKDNGPHSFVSGRMRRDPSAVITAGLAVGGIGAAVAFLGSLSWAIPHPFPFLVIAVLVAIVALAFTRRHDGQWQYPTPPPAPPGAQPGGAAAQPGGAAESGGSAPGSSPASGTATNLPAAVPPAGYPMTMSQATTVLPTTGAATEATPSTQGQRPSAPAWWQREQVPPGGAPFPPGSTFPPSPARPKSHLFAITMAVTAMAIAVAWIVDATTSLDPDPSVYPGIALGIIAIGLLVSAWWGRSRGLIAMGIIASLLTAGAAFLGPGPYGDVVHDPTSADQLRSSYRLGAGQLTLRLEDVADIENLAGASTTINARFGRVLLVIPSSIRATVDATVDHGEIDGASTVQDRDNDGQHALLSPAADGRPAMAISVHLRFGQIEIERAACPDAGLLPLPGEPTDLWKGDTNVAAACN